MIFKPMVSPRSTNNSSIPPLSNFRLETLDEAKARLGEKFAIYEDEVSCRNWKIYYIKNNLLVTETVSKDLVFISEVTQ